MINYIDEGLTKPNFLLCILEHKYSFTDKELQCISEVENHKGAWVVTFQSRPPLRLILIIISIFEHELSYDYLDALRFDGEKFENLSGTKDGYPSLISLLEKLGNKVLV